VLSKAGAVLGFLLAALADELRGIERAPGVRSTL
jgi:hypothetical protein